MSSLPAYKMCRAMLPCIVMLVVAGCGHEQVRRLPGSGTSNGTVARVPESDRHTAGEQAAVVAVRQIGVPYLYGGSTTRGFDCSGLVQYAWSQAGTRIPRTTTEQWRQLAPVSGHELKVGDVLFFRIDGKVSHVGMYLGDRRFVHAPSTGREVTIASLESEFYRRTFIRGARPE